MILTVHPTWRLEAELGVWFFGDNNDFLYGGGQTSSGAITTAGGDFEMFSLSYLHAW